MFEDPEVLDKNGGPIIVDIAKMYTWYSENDWMRLYAYFENIINLSSLMCLSRNYAGILKMKDIYQQDFVMHTFLDNSVTDKLRSYFGKLLLSLHIDKDPMEPVNVPNLTRVWHDVKNAKIEIQASIIKIDKTLQSLKGFCIKYFQELHGT